MKMAVWIIVGLLAGIAGVYMLSVPAVCVWNDTHRWFNVVNFPALMLWSAWVSLGLPPQQGDAAFGLIPVFEVGQWFAVWCLIGVLLIIRPKKIRNLTPNQQNQSIVANEPNSDL